MQTECVKVRGIEFGCGMPKLCVPIVATTIEGIIEQGKGIVSAKPDCIELRMDWFQNVNDVNQVLQVLKELRAVIGETVLLFTFRTDNEGGERAITVGDYIQLCKIVCESEYIDLLDVEAFMQEGLLYDLTEVAHENGVYVVASNHDFEKTPKEKELLERFAYMERQGADILKIAVMPQQERDVLELLSATLRYHESGGRRPTITMSMKEMGIVSRIAGETFGSAMTFVTVGKSSAPGQIPIEEAREILNVLHRK